MIQRALQKGWAALAAASAGFLLAVAVPVPAQAATGQFTWFDGELNYVTSVHGSESGCFETPDGINLVNQTDVTIELHEKPGCGREGRIVPMLKGTEGSIPRHRFQSVRVQ